MNRVFAAGIILSVLGLAGYVFATVTAYPGRAFTVTGVMIGITLVAIRRIEEVST